MTNDFFSVSRIEGDIAVLEFPDGSFKEVSITILPVDVKPGNVLKKTEENLFPRRYGHPLRHDQGRDLRQGKGRRIRPPHRGDLRTRIEDPLCSRRPHLRPLRGMLPLGLQRLQLLKILKGIL